MPFCDQLNRDVGPGLCKFRHLHAKKKKALGRLVDFNPCLCCPEVIELMKKEEMPMQKEPVTVTQPTPEPEQDAVPTCGSCGKPYAGNGPCHSCRGKKGGAISHKNHVPTLNKCRECGRMAKNHGRGLCQGCYNSLKKEGTLDEKHPVVNTFPFKKPEPQKAPEEAFMMRLLEENPDILEYLKDGMKKEFRPILALQIIWTLRKAKEVGL